MAASVSNPTQELIDAAMALVEQRIYVDVRPDSRESGRFCMDCDRGRIGDGPIPHGESCVAGAVVAAVGAVKAESDLDEVADFGLTQDQYLAIGFACAGRDPFLLAIWAAGYERMKAQGEQQVLRRASLAQDDSGQEVCLHCGPSCLGGAAHNARREDGVVWSASLPPTDIPYRPTDAELAASGVKVGSTYSVDSRPERRVVLDEPVCVYCGHARAAHTFEKGNCLDPETGMLMRPVRVFVAEVSR